MVAEQATRFEAVGQPWEWKYYSYDLPTDLPERLRAAGLSPDPVEALLVSSSVDDILRHPSDPRGCR